MTKIIYRAAHGNLLAIGGRTAMNGVTGGLRLGMCVGADLQVGWSEAPAKSLNRPRADTALVGSR
jgi:hypothetical protein